MMQRSAGIIPAGSYDWRLSRSGRLALVDEPEPESAPCCPLAIIARGIVVLSIVVGGLGYALASFGPSQPPDVEVASPTFTTPERSIAVASIGAFAAAQPSAALAERVALRVAAPQNPQVRRTFLTMLQSALATHKKVLEFGPMRVKRSLVETIVKAAQVTDTDPVLLMAIADKESSFSTGVAARSSSALGLFQFVDETWLKAVRRFGPQFGLAKEASEISGSPDRPYVADPAEREHILELRTNPYLSAVLAAEMLKRDGQEISQRIGRSLTGGETYLAHFLGPDDAEKFMEKVVGQPQYMAAALLPRPARANESIFYARAGRGARELSVAAVHHKFEEMMGMRLARYQSLGAAAGLSAFADGSGQ